MTRDERRVARRTVRRIRGRLKSAVRRGQHRSEDAQVALAERLRATVKGLVF